MRWGDRGRGDWVTIYTNPSHAYMIVAGLRFDTSARRQTGNRWTAECAPPLSRRGTPRASDVPLLGLLLLQSARWPDSWSDARPCWRRSSRRCP
jgi:hypothetical protein